MAQAPTASVARIRPDDKTRVSVDTVLEECADIGDEARIEKQMRAAPACSVASGGRRGDWAVGPRAGQAHGEWSDRSWLGKMRAGRRADAESMASRITPHGLPTLLDTVRARVERVSI
jgi:hypothetical protein